MCVYDFEYYMVDSPPRPFDPAVHAQCACRSVAPGDTVTIWTEDREEEEILCPSARRDPWGGIHDDHDCGYCDDGFWVSVAVTLATATRCARCDVAAKLLHDWCDGMYSVEDIPTQIADHWDEDALYRSVSFGRLVVLARRGWRTRMRDGGWVLADVDTLQDLLTSSPPRKGGDSWSARLDRGLPEVQAPSGPIRIGAVGLVIASRPTDPTASKASRVSDPKGSYPRPERRGSPPSLVARSIAAVEGTW